MAAKMLVCALYALLLVVPCVIGLGKLPMFQQEVYLKPTTPFLRSLVAMNPSGTRAVIGSTRDNTAVALIFDRFGNTWKKTAALHYTDTAPRGQVLVVAMSGDGNTVVSTDTKVKSASGAAYVFHCSRGVWDAGVKLVEPSPGTNHYFGLGAAISQDGNTIGITTLAENGSIVVFGRTESANSWHFQGILKYATTIGYIGQVGQGIGFSANGSLAVYGAPSDAGQEGTFGFFKRNSTMGWNQSGPKISSAVHDEDRFGWRMAMSADGGIVLVGGISGAWVYHLTGGGTTYTHLQALVAPRSTDYFGAAVAMTSDGKRIVIGDYHANLEMISQYNQIYRFYKGGAFIFDRLGSASNPYTLTGNITVPFIQSGSVYNDYSGFGLDAMAVSDENHVLVTAYGGSNNLGASFRSRFIFWN